MATKFLEPGGDADFGILLWGGAAAGLPAVATDFVNTGHLKSIKYRPNQGDVLRAADGTFTNTGGRINLYAYFVALPTTATTGLTAITDPGGALSLINLKMTTAGVLQLWNRNVAQIGTDGPTLAISKWYRISLAYTVTSSTVNRIELKVFDSTGASVGSISITNATLDAAATTISTWIIGNLNANVALDWRSSDHYGDDSTALTDTGPILVTAKRPFSNGSANNFTTQIGVGGSGYGSGHSPQVNERALSKTNGWSMVGAGSAVTEEYTVEDAATGDANISSYSIIDWMSWIYTDATVGETGTIIAGGTSSTFTLPASPNTRLVTLIKGSKVYPAGGTDVGITTDTALTTVNLYECGVVIAYNPLLSAVAPMLPLMGVG